MYDPQKKWPLELHGERLVIFIGLTIIAFILVGTLDTPVTRDVARLPEIIRDPFHIITRPGNSDWIFFPSIIVTLVGWLVGTILSKQNIWRHRAHIIAMLSGFVIAGVGFPGILAQLIKRLVGRARPVNFEQYGSLHFEPFRDWIFHSFPSGDATTMFAFAAVVAFFIPRLKWLLLIAAIAVAVARVMLAMHFPTDVLAGALLGTFGAFAARNFYLHRGWLFKTDEAGRIVPNIVWPKS